MDERELVRIENMRAAYRRMPAAMAIERHILAGMMIEREVPALVGEVRRLRVLVRAAA